MSRKLIRNVFSNWAGLALNMATAFFMSPFLVRNLGDTWYGIWVLIRSTTGYMSLVDGGLRVSIVKYVARTDAIEDTTELNRTVSTATAIYGVITLIVLAATFVLSLVFHDLFNLSPEIVTTAQIVVFVAGTSVALSLASAVFGGFVAGMQRYDVANVIGIGLLIVRTIAIVALIWKGYGIIALALVHLAMQCLNGVLITIVSFRLKPDLEIKPRHVNAASARTLYGYSAVILVNTLSDLLLFRTGEILAGMFLGPVAVTYYAIAGTLAEYLQKIIVMMTMVLHPYSSAKEATGDAEGLRLAVIVGTKMCLLIALPATTILLLLGRPFIEAWMGASYAIQAAPVLVVMSLARLAWLAQSGTGMILLGINRHKELTTINAIAGVVSFAGGFLMVRYGLFWMSVGAAVPLALIYGLIMPLFTMRVLDIRLIRYLREGVLRPVYGTVPFALTLLGIITVHHPQTLIGIATSIVLASPGLLLGVWFFAFTERERRHYAALLVPSRRMLSPEQAGL